MGIMNVGLVVKIFVINEKDQVLLLQRSAKDDLFPLDWDLPGGSIKNNENPEQAVLRELQEEAGIEVTGCSIIHIGTEREPHYTLTLIYTGRAKHENIVLSHEHQQYKWVEPSAIASMTELPIKYQQAARLLIP